MDTQKIIRNLYKELDELSYSEQNIVELLFLYDKIEQYLVDNYPECKCLVYIRNTRKKEIDTLVKNNKVLDNVSFLFKDAKANLLSDLDNFCLDVWNPLKR
jgi:hypothetical protein